MQTVNAESGSLYPWGPGNKQWPLNGTPLRAAWWRQQSILLHHNCNFHYIRIWFMQRGKLHLEGFIGARFPLSGLQQAFDYLHEPNTDVMKVAIMVQ